MYYYNVSHDLIDSQLKNDSTIEPAKKILSDSLIIVDKCINNVINKHAMRSSKISSLSSSQALETKIIPLIGVKSSFSL